MAVRTLWKFVVGRAKTFINNYNVIERSEVIMESNKRVPPRHPGTEAKFKVLIKGWFIGIIIRTEFFFSYLFI